MKKILLIFLITISFFSCQNYESNKYIENENIAINDLILEMIKFDEIVKLNNWENQKLKLYVFSKLDTITAYSIEPTGYDIGANGINYPIEKIEENKKRFENELERFEKEERLFAKLKKGKIKERNLNYNFTNEKIDFEYINLEEIKDFNPKKNEYGYLGISRIIFNSSYTVGYLHYGFFCGDLCAWDDNIKIEKINGKWKITERYSGGVS
ncbi:conserved hypothetical protein [Tenacibaculum maritimum]|uniref:hypothetical protein n=1 Tax=Tenacibaculum maritimum TaxID=107401 RepID=UPI0012E69DB0|nr:hypothetical protein [Tenacibaculum maritimum]CAA0144576.1 conserved hypothetical protein [Tenacibaculum maritimum]CAA0159536.1 conserved hypothetical protein [Tenacibaculum maritimum]